MSSRRRSRVALWLAVTGILVGMLVVGVRKARESRSVLEPEQPSSGSLDLQPNASATPTEQEHPAAQGDPLAWPDPLPGSVPLRGIVRDVSGGVIEGALIRVQSDSLGASPYAGAVSDDAGAFVLWALPGRVELLASAEGYAQREQPAVAPGPEVELPLIPESTLAGRVVAVRGAEPLTSVVVTAHPVSPGGTGGQAQTADDTGKFVIRGLEPGLYTVEARGEHHYGQAAELVHLALAESTSGVLVEVHPAFVVRGRVVVRGEDEQPCALGHVRLIDIRDPSGGRRSAVAANGEVELRGVLPGNYAVQVACDGAIAGPVPELVVADRDLKGLRWELREGLVVRGTTVDPAGAPIPGVHVRARAVASEGRGRASGPSSAGGEFEITGLTPGRFALVAEAPQASEPVEVVLEPGQDLAGVRLELAPTGVVNGRVVDERGRPVAGVGVQARRGAEALAVASSDARGRFALELAAGELELVVFEDESGAESQVVEVLPGLTTEAELVVPDRDGSIRGRVLDHDGAPMVDAFVSARQVEGADPSDLAALRWGAAEHPVMTDVDGRFRIDGLISNAQYSLGAFRRGGGEAFATGVSPGERVELILQHTGALEGEVAPAPEQFTVSVRSEDAGLTRAVDLFRTRGRFVLEGLPPGKYAVVIEAPAGVGRLSGVELEAGGVAQVHVELRSRVAVQGRLVDAVTGEPVAGVAVEIKPAGGMMRFVPRAATETSGWFTDAAGRFEVSEAPTGPVRVWLDPRGAAATSYAWQSVDLVVPESPHGGAVVELGVVAITPDG